MKKLMLLSMLGVCLAAGPSAHAAPVAFSVGIGVGPVYAGPAPVCRWGYYSYYPYACAPYGYYGPEWFSGGVFIGAGPWFHGFAGRPGFYGRPGYYGHPGLYGQSGFRGGSVARGTAPYSRGPVGNGFHSNYTHGGHTWNSFHGGAHR